MILDYEQLTLIYNNAVNTAKEKYIREYNTIKDFYSKEFEHFDIEFSSDIDNQYRLNVLSDVTLTLNKYVPRKYRIKQVKSINDFINMYNVSVSYTHKENNIIGVYADDIQANHFADNIIRICNFSNICSYIRFINSIFDLDIPTHIRYYNNRDLDTWYKINDRFNYRVTFNKLEIEIKRGTVI